MPKSKPQPLQKRPRGHGSAIRRRDLWYGRIRSEGRDKIVTPSYGTEEEALEALDRFIQGAPDPRLIPTLSRWWESLIEDDGDFVHGKDIETCNLYDTVWANFIRRDPIGLMRLDEVRRRDVQRWVDKLYRTKAPSTVRRYGSCMSVVLQAAVDAEILSARLESGKVIPANPAAGVRFRAIPEAASYIFNDMELANYPELLYGFHRRLSAMVTVLADAGVRPGELCGMMTSDIEDGVWTIHQIRLNNGKLKPRTKTGKVRKIKLSGDALAAIAEQGSNRGAVWLTDEDQPVRPGGLALHLRRFRAHLQTKIDAEWKEEGESPQVPPLTATNFRRTFITRGVHSGDGKATQTAAGHASYKTTYDIYAKYQKDPQAQLIDKLAGSVKRSVFQPVKPESETEKQA